MDQVRKGHIRYELGGLVGKNKIADEKGWGDNICRKAVSSNRAFVSCTKSFTSVFV